MRKYVMGEGKVLITQGIVGGNYFLGIQHAKPDQGGKCTEWMKVEKGEVVPDPEFMLEFKNVRAMRAWAYSILESTFSK